MVSSFLLVCASNNNTKPLNTARISLLWGVHGQTSVKRGKKKKKLPKVLAGRRQC